MREISIEEAKRDATRLELWIPNVLLEQASDDVILKYIQEVVREAVANRSTKPPVRKNAF